MEIKHIIRGLTLGIMTISSVLLISCGSNLAGEPGIDKSDTSVTGIELRVDYAESPSDYEAIVRDTTLRLNESGLNTDEQVRLLNARSTGYLGSENLRLLSVAANIESAVNDDNNASSNLFEILQDAVGQSSSQNIRLAADDANSASNLASVNNIERASRDEFNRAVSNLLVVNNMLTAVYDIEETGDGEYEATKKSAQSNEDILDELFDPSEGESISNYFVEMERALNQSNVLDEENSDEVNDMADALEQLEGLQDAIDNGAITYTTTFDSGRSNTVYPITSDGLQGVAIDGILSTAFD
jgi:hypothetical protein